MPSLIRYRWRLFWLARKLATRQVGLARDIAKAKADGDSEMQEVTQVCARWELISLNNDIAKLHTGYWLPLGRKWLVPIPDPIRQDAQPSGTYSIDAETIAEEGLHIPDDRPATNAEDEKFWRYPGGFPVLTDYGLRYVRKGVKDARRSGRNEWGLWLSIMVAILSVAVAVLLAK